MSQVLEILLLLCWSHLCLAADVIQKPQFHIALPMDNVTLHCEHDDTSYNTKFWYRQEKRKVLVLIGYVVNDALTMETGFTDGRLKMQPNGIKTNVLNISHASTQDSAVYYCASRQGTTSAAYFGEGTVVSVLEEGKEQKKPDVSIYRPKKRELEDNNFISLVCVASNFFPEHVKIRWFVNSEERINLYEPVPQKNADDSYSTSKRLTLTREEYFNPDTTFRCVAAFLDGTLEASEEIKGETDCGVSKEFYTMYINQGKISYIMVLCKSGLYALVVLVLVWRKKVIAHSY